MLLAYYPMPLQWSRGGMAVEDLMPRQGPPVQQQELLPLVLLPLRV
jgi:hypothetical protein